MRRTCFGCNSQFEMKTSFCKECRERLKNVCVREDGVTITKHKKGRSQKEKDERRNTSFRKEVLPDLRGGERRYFEKKYGKPL